MTELLPCPFCGGEATLPEDCTLVYCCGDDCPLNANGVLMTPGDWNTRSGVSVDWHPVWTKTTTNRDVLP